MSLNILDFAFADDITPQREMTSINKIFETPSNEIGDSN